MLKVVLLAAIGLGATLAGASHTGRSSSGTEQPHATRVDGQVAASASTLASAIPESEEPLLYSVVTSLGDFKGASLGLPDGSRAQVLDLQWGLDEDSKLFPAFVEFLTEDGRTVHTDQRDRAIRIFLEFEEMSGFLMDVGTGGFKQTVWVDRIQFGIRHDGALVRLGLSGATLAGQAFNDLLLPDGPIAACACVYMLNCSTNATCNQCKGPADNCACHPQGGSGRCNMVTECHCPSDGYCTGGDTCQGQIVNNVASCACKP